MRKNIDEVLNRGERLDHLVDSTQQLKSEASKYKWGAKKFSLQVMWNQWRRRAARMPRARATARSLFVSMEG